MAHILRSSARSPGTPMPSAMRPPQHPDMVRRSSAPQPLRATTQQISMLQQASISNAHLWQQKYNAVNDTNTTLCQSLAVSQDSRSRLSRFNDELQQECARLIDINELQHQNFQRASDSRLMALNHHIHTLRDVVKQHESRTVVVSPGMDDKEKPMDALKEPSKATPPTTYLASFEDAMVVLADLVRRATNAMKSFSETKSWDQHDKHDMMKDKDELKQQVFDLQDRVNESQENHETQRVELQNKIDNLEEQAREQEEELSLAKQQLASLAETATEQRAALDQDLDEARKENALLKRDNDGLKQQACMHEDELSKAKQQIETLKKTEEDERIAFNANRERQCKEITDLKDKRKADAEDYASYKRKYDAAEVQLKLLKAQKNDNLSRTKELQTANSEQLKTITFQLTTIKEQEASLKRQRDISAERDSIIVDQRKAIDDHEAEIECLQDDCRNKNAELKDLRVEVAASKAKLDRLKGRAESFCEALWWDEDGPKKKRPRKE